MKHDAVIPEELDTISEAQMQVFAEQFNAIEPGSGLVHISTDIAQRIEWSGIEQLALLGGLSTLALIVTLGLLAFPNVIQKLRQKTRCLLKLHLKPQL